MTDVLIRDVPKSDLDEIRSAAAERGTSVQSYLRETVHAQAVYRRRQAALARASRRLRGQSEVPAEERNAVLEAIDETHRERGDALSDRDAR